MKPLYPKNRRPVALPFLITAIALANALAFTLPSFGQEITTTRDGLIPWFKDRLGKSGQSSPSKQNKSPSKSMRIPKGGTLVLTEHGPLNPQQLATLQAHDPVVTPLPSQQTPPGPSPQSAPPTASPPPVPSAPSTTISNVDPELTRRQKELDSREKAIADREAEIQARLDADHAELQRREEELNRQKAQQVLQAKEFELASREERLTWKEAEADHVAKKLERLPAEKSSHTPPDAPEEPKIEISRSSIPTPAAKPSKEIDPVPARPIETPDSSPLAETTPASFETISPENGSDLTPLAGDATPSPEAIEAIPEKALSQTGSADAVAKSNSPTAPAKSSQAPPAPPNEPRYVIGRDHTPIYIEGPTQITPADAYLDSGTPVFLVAEERAWSKVRLESGVSGYVASDSMKSADPSAPKLPLPERNLDSDDQSSSRTAARNPLLHF
ncbi:MAG: SH3 domain-containing protein [Verrucomicrobiota bacterium]